MIFNNYKILLNLNGADLYNDLYNEFDSYYFTTTIFKGRELYVEFRYTLFKAFTLIK